MANSTQIIDTPFGAIALVYIASLLHKTRQGVFARISLGK